MVNDIELDSTTDRFLLGFEKASNPICKLSRVLIEVMGDEIYRIDSIGASDLGPTGTTVIDGDRITTGTIDADLVNVTNLDASEIKTGVIYNAGGSAGSYTMKIDLDNGEIHIV